VIPKWRILGAATTTVDFEEVNDIQETLLKDPTRFQQPKTGRRRRRRRTTTTTQQNVIKILP